MNTLYTVFNKLKNKINFDINFNIIIILQLIFILESIIFQVLDGINIFGNIHNYIEISVLIASILCRKSFNKPEDNIMRIGFSMGLALFIILLFIANVFF